jgi:hypothetical protein
MPSWGTNTASLGGLSHYWLAAYLAVALGYNSARNHICCVYLRLDRRAIQSNIGFTPKDQAVIHPPGPRANSDHFQRKRAHVIHVYDTPAFIKGICIFNPEEMAIERISAETWAKRLLTLFHWRMAITMPDPRDAPIP